MLSKRGIFLAALLLVFYLLFFEMHFVLGEDGSGTNDPPSTSPSGSSYPSGSGGSCYFGSRACIGTRVFGSYHVCCNPDEQCTYYDYSPLGLLPVCLPQCIEPNVACNGEGLYNLYWACCAPGHCQISSSNGAPYCSDVLPTAPCPPGTFKCDSNGTDYLVGDYVCCSNNNSVCGYMPVPEGKQAICLEETCSDGQEKCENKSNPDWKNYSICCPTGNCRFDSSTGGPFCLDSSGSGVFRSGVFPSNIGAIFEVSSCDHYNYVDGNREQQCRGDCANVSHYDAENYFSYSYGFEVNSYKCAWDSNAHLCYFWYNVSSRTTSDNASCTLLHSSIIECDKDNDVYNSPFFVINNTGKLETCTSVTCGSQQCERILLCPKQVKLPFFSWLNLMLVVLIIAGVYFIKARRRFKK